MATLRESEVKNQIRKEYFDEYDWTRAIGDIDLTICSTKSAEDELINSQVTYLWCETKTGTKRDIYESFIQLILTVGKARTYEREIPPYFLGAADAEKIAFVEYSKVMHIFSKTDFNWNVTPSDHGTKEFRELYSLLHDELINDVVIFKYAYDDKTLRKFIKKNFKGGRIDMAKIPVGKNNFTYVYYDWVKSVKDSIAVDWPAMQKAGILDCDFFLADLMSKDGMSIKDKLKVVLEKTKYKVLVKADLGGIFGDAFKEFSFKDEQRAYNQFWNRYERPPKPIYQRYILDRRDLLVPQDIREIKGSYYTPEQWVRLSQEYLAKALGEDWQEEYYIWDCAAGSGNLLRGLTNKYNIYASTLDDSDVKVMHDAIDGGRLNLLKNNVFQFDFLNDGYKKASDGSWLSDLANCEKIPESLRKIIANPDKRKRLVVYINPPYAEGATAGTITGTGKNKTAITQESKAYEMYADKLGLSARELFALFCIRVSKELSGCILAHFSKLKILQAPAFAPFRDYMDMSLRSLFIVPGNTFDNVDGHFPIGFHIWETNRSEVFKQVTADAFVFDGQKNYRADGTKLIRNYDGDCLINSWLSGFLLSAKSADQRYGYLCYKGNDFQNQKYITIEYPKLSKSTGGIRPFGLNGIFPAVIEHAVRQIPKPTWVNDRDQFLAPKESWSGDLEFQTDCLVWSFFNNAVHEEKGVCHWIPFYEDEVNSPSPFNSRFMADFLHGKIERQKVEVFGGLFEQQEAEEAANMVPFDALSDEAKAVLDAGKEIWKYYMSKPGVSVNASFLDIRAYFQGYKTTEKGKRMMNSSSEDTRYTLLLANLRTKMKALEAHIEPKIYEHGFLLR